MGARDGCLTTGVWVAVAILGGVALYFASVRPIAEILDARSWAPTPCVIVSSRVVEEPSSGASEVEILYTYEVDGRTYQGDRLDFDAGSAVQPAVLARIVEAHPVGAELDCWVDPDDPARSVIDRSPGRFLLWGILAGAFLVIGIGGLMALLVIRGVIPVRRS